jgi:hypothetical protein
MVIYIIVLYIRALVRTATYYIISTIKSFTVIIIYIYFNVYLFTCVVNIITDLAADTNREYNMICDELSRDTPCELYNIEVYTLNERFYAEVHNIRIYTCPTNNMFLTLSLLLLRLFPKLLEAVEKPFGLWLLGLLRVRQSVSCPPTLSGVCARARDVENVNRMDRREN